MNGAVQGAGMAPPAAQPDAASTPNQGAWNAATSATGSTANAAQQQMMTKMEGQIEQVMMMPLILQAQNAGQDDS